MEYGKTMDSKTEVALDALVVALNALKTELGVWKYEKEYPQFKCSRIFVDMRIAALERAIKQLTKS